MQKKRRPRGKTETAAVCNTTATGRFIKQQFPQKHGVVVRPTCNAFCLVLVLYLATYGLLSHSASSLYMNLSCKQPFSDTFVQD